MYECIMCVCMYVCMCVCLCVQSISVNVQTAVFMSLKMSKTSKYFGLIAVSNIRPKF